MIVLNSEIYVNANLNDNSPYKIEIVDEVYSLLYKSIIICNIDIIQPPIFALQCANLKNGKLITDLVNVHGDRIRIQPIHGCANSCSFCSLNKFKCGLQSLDDLDDAFQYALHNIGFRNALISGGLH